MEKKKTNDVNFNSGYFLLVSYFFFDNNKFIDIYFGRLLPFLAFVVFLMVSAVDNNDI